MTLEIELTDLQVAMLKQFAANHHAGAKDNLGTYKPLHIVQEYDPYIIHGAAYECNEVLYYCNENGQYYDSPEELVANVNNTPVDEVAPFRIDTEINQTKIYDLSDYFDAYGVCGEIVGSVRRYRNVSYHFSLIEAQRYIEYQKHNLNNPRIYTVDPGYGNVGDYEPFWDLLMTIGTKINKSECQSADIPENQVAERVE